MATKISRICASNESMKKNLSSVVNQINTLPPSPELLSYYKRKFEEFDQEFENIYKDLLQYKNSCLHQHQLTLEITERDDIIIELQQTISDLQLCLLQERNLVLKLKSENEQLKNREKIKWNRHDSSVAPENYTMDGLTLLLNEPPDLIHRDQGDSDIAKQDTPLSLQHFASQKQYQNLVNKLRNMEVRLQEESMIKKNEINLLLEDRRIQMGEFLAKQKADSVKIQILSQKLKSTQDLLHDNMKKYVELKKSLLKVEQQLLEEREKSYISKEVKDLTPNQKVIQETSDPDAAILTGKNLIKVKQKFPRNDKMTNYQLRIKPQVISKSTNVTKKEDCKCKDQTKVLAEQVDVLKTKCNKMQEKHRLEVEGFRCDIQSLQKQIVQIEGQLYKLCMLSDSLGPRKDDTMLQLIHNTSKRSVNIMDNLNELKKKIYRLEKNLKLL